MPSSRPNPDCFIPPNGVATRTELFELTLSTPASTPRATRSARAPSRVQIEPESPYGVSFASRIASASSTNGVTAAQTRVSKAEKGVADAQAALDKATAQFCGEAKDYIEAVDRYGKAFDESAATVGDIKTAGADLEQPRSSVVSDAEAVTTFMTGLPTKRATTRWVGYA